ncbi:MAG: hypothetical protein IJX16_02850 [Clostridia bacterium]|nr:hypothetical protein [Clostridia bacterium]
MKKKGILSLFLTLIACLFVFSLSACDGGEPPHTHVFDKMVSTSTYLSSEATCEESAKYFYSCDCGEACTETFDYGSAKGHNYGEVSYAWSSDDSSCTASRTC